MAGNTNLRRLRLLLAGFVLALAVPGAVLIYHTYNQLQWQAFFSSRQQAQGLYEQIDRSIAQLAESQIMLPLNQLNDNSGAAGSSNRAALLNSPPSARQQAIGLLGFFEVDAAGRLVPAEAGDQDRLPPGASPGDQAPTENDVTASLYRQLDAVEKVLVNNEILLPAPATTSEPLVEAAAASSQSTGGRSERESQVVLTSANRVSQSPTAKVEASEAGSRFDRLADNEVQQVAARKQANYGQVSDLNLDQSLQQQAARRRQKASSIEVTNAEALLVPTQSPPVAGASADAALAEPLAEPLDGALAEQLADAADEQAQTPQPIALPDGVAADFSTITTFSDADAPLRFSLLDSGHFVFYRNLWRPDGRVVQGALLESERVLGQIRQQIEAAGISGVQVLIAYGGTVLEAVAAPGQARSYGSASRARGQLLLRGRLSPPISAMELVFFAEKLPLGAGLNLLLWLSLTLALVLLGGALALYRLGTGQLQLARQQRDFVSAVSHELKTPLTSIRMYGEMLVNGLAPADRQPQYFSYIFEESERLSRLIDNVLQLARFDRGEMNFHPVPISVGELLDLVKSRISSQVAGAGFELEIDPGPAAQVSVNVDPDAMLQVFINLVDNALKFTAGQGRQRIEISAVHRSGQVVLAVRDFGPGIAADQIGKVFRLFYRSESELTRDTIGTGIGLSLVQQIVTAMAGTIDVQQSHPGARFEMTLPEHQGAPGQQPER